MSPVITGSDAAWMLSPALLPWIACVLAPGRSPHSPYMKEILWFFEVLRH
jgi:hypothetical protein